MIDQDLVIVNGAARDVADEDPVFRRVKAVQESRVAYLGDFKTPLGFALGFNSPLSLPFALDIMVLALEEDL